MSVQGFPPVFDGNSRVLILGSFPSVKSRAEGFYYGNPRNRFWDTVCGFFGEKTPKTVEEKRAFLLRRGIALWDVYVSCEISGSADSAIRNAVAADIPALAAKCPLRAILCNGLTAYSLLEARFPELLPLAERLPSTSPANPRFFKESWTQALGKCFGDEELRKKG